MEIIKKSDKKKIKGFLFDMDGTLFDTERLYYDMWQIVAKEENIYLDDDMLDLMRGADPRIGAEVFNEKNPGKSFWDYRELRMKKVYEYIDKYGVPKKKGFDFIIPYLRQYGYKIAIASSSPETQIKRYLSSLNLQDSFDLIVAGEMVKNGKPDPDIFVYGAGRLGLLPSECVVCEDSVNGIKAGYNSGAYVLGLRDMMDIEPVKELLHAELLDLSEIKEWLEI